MVFILLIFQIYTFKGAAAGVSAAFGAPVSWKINKWLKNNLCFNISLKNINAYKFYILQVGGVLFSLEEAASFWNLPVTLRTVSLEYIIE